MSKMASVPEIVSSIKSQKDNLPRFALFIGAGASASSRIPMASQMTADLLTEIYERDMGKKDADIGEVREWCKDQTWWTQNPIESEYSRAFGERFNTDAERRDYIEEAMKDAVPGLTYLCIADLLAAEMIKVVFTTNFDDMLNDACIGYNLCKPLVCAHESTIASIPSRSPRPEIIKLHGDFLFNKLKVRDEDVKTLDEKMMEKLKKHTLDCGLIFVGYSGCDNSVMKILEKLEEEEGNCFPYGVFWATLEPDDLNERVKAFLNRRGSFRIVKIEDSDSFFAELHQTLELPIPQLFDRVLDRPLSILDGIRPTDPPQSVPKHVEAFYGDLVEQYDSLKGSVCLPKFSSEESRSKLNLEDALMKSWTLSSAKQYDEAMKIIEECLIDFPESPEAFFALGTMLYLKGKEKADEKLLEESFKKYELAVKYKRDYSIAYCNWGNALLGLGKLKGDEKPYEESFKKYELAVKYEQDDHEVYYNWGTALLDLGKLKGDEKLYEESFKKYELAVKYEQDDHEAHNNWGDALLELGKLRGDEKLFEEALEKCSTAEKLKPGSGSYNIACAYSLLGESKEAISWLKKALEYDEKDRELAKSDEDFDNVRDLPEFKKLLKKPAPKKKKSKKKK